MPSSMEHAELTTEQVLRRDISWKTYLTTKLIDAPTLQLLQCYDNLSESDRASLIDEDGPTYIRVFVSLLRDISKEETVEYVLALIDEMLSANPRRARFFHDESLVSEDVYGPFLRLVWESNWFIQERSCKALSLIVSMRPRSRSHGAYISNNEASSSKDMITTIDHVLRGLLDWLVAQIKKPSHPTYSVPTAINSLAILLKEHCVRISFLEVDGVKLLIPLISPADSQPSIQIVYELCLCIWLLSYCDVAVDHLASTRVIPQLVDVVKCSTKEKVVRIVIMIFKNLLSKGTFGAQMVDVGLLQIVQNLKAQSWSDEDLLEALNILEEGLIDNIKKSSSFDQYKREVLLGQLDWTPMHKDPGFWRENIMKFEENNFQIVRALITALSTSNDPKALAVACHDLSQFIRHHPGGRMVVSNMKAKELVMNLMDHEQTEVTKNALLCIQRLFLGAKYVNFLQA